MKLDDCQAEDSPLRLHHVCQGVYVVLNDIYFYGGERKICHSCVDKIQGGVSQIN